MSARSNFLGMAFLSVLCIIPGSLPESPSLTAPALGARRPSRLRRSLPAGRPELHPPFRDRAVLADHLTFALLGAPQRPSLLISRPFLPPLSCSSKRETGASGTASKVVRRAPLDACRSCRPARCRSGPPGRATRSGSLCVERAQVDRARSAAGRAAASSPRRCPIDRPGRAGVARRTGPACRRCRCGRCRAARPAGSVIDDPADVRFAGLRRERCADRRVARAGSCRRTASGSSFGPKSRIAQFATWKGASGSRAPPCRR